MYEPRHGEVPAPHVTDELAGYVLRELSAADEHRIKDHLAQCADCAADLRAWVAIAAVERDAARSAPAPASIVLRRVFAAIPSADEQAGASEAAHLPELSTSLVGMPVHPASLAWWVASARHAAAVGWAQTRIIQRAVWPASAAGIVLAVLFAGTVSGPTGAADVLTFALPLITSAGTAFLYGNEVDASLELTLGTPTSARVVLLGRVVLLFGFDLALALLGSGALAATRGQSAGALVPSWLGPMALLAALSLALSLTLGPLLGVAAAWALWISRSVQLVAGREGETFRLSAAHLWHTTPLLVGVAIGLLVLAVLVAPRIAPPGLQR